MTGRMTLPTVRGNSAFFSLSDSDDVELATLAALYLAGVRRVVAEPLPDDVAEPASAHRLADVVARMNALLTSRGRRPVGLAQADKRALKAWRREILDESAPDAGRRRFLTRFAQPVAEVIEDETPELDPLAEVQAINAARPGALFAYAPEINPSRCTGCDACVNVCPKEALILLKDADQEPCYRMQAQDCDGCGLCVEMCDSDAIQLIEMAEQTKDVSLEAFHCRDCGVDVHEPRGHVSDDGLCRICRSTGHQKKLFQVLP